MAGQCLDTAADYYHQIQESVVCGRLPRFLATLATPPEDQVLLILQSGSVENEMHWAGDVQLGEGAHRYTSRIGAAVFSFLRAVAMNLLRCGSIAPSIRALGSSPTPSKACSGCEASQPNSRAVLIALLCSFGTAPA